MRVIIAASPVLKGGIIVEALMQELGDEPRSRIVVVYPSTSGMHEVARQLANELGVDGVAVDNRLNHNDDGEIMGMLKEYEQSGKVSILIIVSPKCIIRLTSSGDALANQYMWEAIPLPRQVSV